MLGEKDISILGRLNDKVNNTSLVQFILYMNNKLEYIKDRIEPAKRRYYANERSMEER